MHDPRYPIGKFIKPEIITSEQLKEWILSIRSFPSRLRTEVDHLSDQQLDTPYREGGWTIRQVVHHCADSHMNAIIRLKLALTEENPTIKPYVEYKWAELKDTKYLPLESSLKILDGVHERWTVLLEELSPSDLKRTFIHPEHGKQFALEENIGMYAWHCDHHLAHITQLKKAKDW